MKKFQKEKRKEAIGERVTMNKQEIDKKNTVNRMGRDGFSERVRNEEWQTDQNGSTKKRLEFRDIFFPFFFWSRKLISPFFRSKKLFSFSK